MFCPKMYFLNVFVSTERYQNSPTCIIILSHAYKESEHSLDNKYNLYKSCLGLHHCKVRPPHMILFTSQLNSLEIFKDLWK